MRAQVSVQSCSSVTVGWLAAMRISVVSTSSIYRLACANNPSSVNVTPNGPITLCDGSSQQLTASATGGSGLSYQWTRNGVNISGANSSTYWASDSGTYTYNCVVTGSGCSSGVQDQNGTQVTWDSEPDFGGATSATPMSGTCGVTLDWDAAKPGRRYHLTATAYSRFASTRPTKSDSISQWSFGDRPSS